MTYQSIPAWLRPYRNDWLTAGGIAKIMRVVSRDPKVSSHPETHSWVYKNQLRFSSVIAGPAPNAKGVLRKYQVKSVWVVAKVDGLDVVETFITSPVDQKIAMLEQENRQWREAQIPQIHVVHAKREFSTSDTLLLKLLVMASDPRPKAGVYFLISNESNITYVGQSKNVLSRMAGHQAKDFDFVRMIEIPDDKQRLEIEMRLIKLLEPRDNLMGLVKAA